MAFPRIHDNRTPHVDAAAGAGGTESWRTGTSVSISGPCRIFMRAPSKGASSPSREFAQTPAAEDPRRATLIADVFADFKRLLAESKHPPAAGDAEAICEAMSRPGMRFVPIKSAEHQATLMLHKTRELLVKQRTMSVNALRSHLSEFGIIIAKGIGRIDELLKLAEADTTPPDAPKTAVKALAAIL
jgi:hypothetical protein